MKHILLSVMLIPSTLLFSKDSSNWDKFLELLNKPSITLADLDSFVIESSNAQSTFKKALDFSDPKNQNYDHFVQSKTYYITRRMKLRTFNRYCLQLIHTQKTILFLHLHEKYPSKTILKKEFKGLEVIQKGFEQKWGLIPDPGDALFLPENVPTIGLACGYGGGMTAVFYEMKALVDENNKDEILNWCRSLVPEYRCVGAMGLHLLQSRGVFLHPSEAHFLKKISQDFTKIKTCYGCTNLGQYSTVQEMYQQGLYYLGIL